MAPPRTLVVYTFWVPRNILQNVVRISSTFLDESRKHAGVMVQEVKEDGVLSKACQLQHGSFFQTCWVHSSWRMVHGHVHGPWPWANRYQPFTGLGASPLALEICRGSIGEFLLAFFWHLWAMNAVTWHIHI